MRTRRGSSHTATHVTFNFWLVFEEDGGIRLTRTEPNLGRTERAMLLCAKLPRSLWKTTSLTGSITVTPSPEGAYEVNLSVVAEALKAALGIDIDLRLADPAAAPIEEDHSDEV